MNKEPSKYWGLKERWPQLIIWFLLVVLFLIPFIFGRWAWQPLVMIIFGIAATQIGAIYRQKLLRNLFGAFALREHLNKRQETEAPQEASQTNEMEKKKLEELKSAVEARLSPPNKTGQDAVDSYLNQSVGTWSMVILCLGIVFALLLRASLGVPGPPWTLTLLVVAAVFLIILLIWNVMGRFTDPNALIIYYGHKKFSPPSGAATLFRVFVLILYSCLVFAASWPKPTDHDGKSNPNSAIEGVNSVTNAVKSGQSP